VIVIVLVRRSSAVSDVGDVSDVNPVIRGRDVSGSKMRLKCAAPFAAKWVIVTLRCSSHALSFFSAPHAQSKKSTELVSSVGRATAKESAQRALKKASKLRIKFAVRNAQLFFLCVVDAVRVGVHNNEVR